MENVREHVAVALLIAALILLAFWGIELRLGLLVAIIAIIGYMAFVPALWEKRSQP